MSDQVNTNNPLPPPPPPPIPTHYSNNPLFGLLNRDKMTGPNYLDWNRALRISLRYEDKEEVIDVNLPDLDSDATDEAIDAYNRLYAESKKVAFIMLGAMSPDLQKSFEHMGAFEINEHLQEMFQEHARQERFQVVYHWSSASTKRELLCVPTSKR